MASFPVAHCEVATILLLRCDWLHCDAGFKCTHEMTQLLAPGGDRGSPSFRLFQDLVVRAFLAVRYRTRVHLVTDFTAQGALCMLDQLLKTVCHSLLAVTI